MVKSTPILNNEVQKPKYSAKYYLSYWRKRKFNIDIIEEKFLIDYIDKVYTNLAKRDKENFILVLNSKEFNDVCVRGILSLDEEFFKPIATTIRSNKSKNSIRKITREELSEVRRRGAIKGQATRINRYKSLNISDEEALYLSYKNGVIATGRNIATALGLDLESLSENDLSKLSGFKKKKNFAETSDEYKLSAKTTWKTSCLRNNNIRAIISSEYPEFSNIDIDTLSSDKIGYWYFQYKSIQSSRALSYTNFSKYKFSVYSSLRFNKNYICRSNLERTFIEYLETIKEVTDVEYEPIAIKYTRDNELNQRRYIPDYLVTLNTSQIYIEVKPKSMIDSFMELKGNFIDTPILIITEYDLRTNKIYELLKTAIDHFRTGAKGILRREMLT